MHFYCFCLSILFLQYWKSNLGLAKSRPTLYLTCISVFKMWNTLLLVCQKTVRTQLRGHLPVWGPQVGKGWHKKNLFIRMRAWTGGCPLLGRSGSKERSKSQLGITFRAIIFDMYACHPNLPISNNATNLTRFQNTSLSGCFRFKPWPIAACWHFILTFIYETKFFIK